nr:N-acetylmuramoyl-L-alanine amidase [Melioribacteraceae bacterium]
ILISTIFPQRLLKISVSKGAEKEFLPYIVKNGVTYVSAKELSKILSGNFYYNPTAQKVEMKFENYNLKVTAKNQFFVIASKYNYEKDVYQIPISTQFIKDDIFIPILYSLKYVEAAYQKKLLYDDKYKNLIVTSKPIDIFKTIETEKHTPLPTVNKKKKTDSKYDIYGIEVSEMANGTLIRLETSQKINMFRSSILNGKLFVFISGASIDPEFENKFKPTGVVRKVNVKHVKGNKQIEFTLKNGTEISNSMQSSSKDIDTDDILISIQNDALNKFTEDISIDKSKWNFDVLVIDAGHGGKDPGTIGITGVKEKNVNLGVALELEKILKQKMPNIKVVQTRTNDKFIELAERGKIANKHDGKLFISIHANALENRKRSDVRGFEVYLLRPGRTQEAIRVAEVENSVIDFEDNKTRYKELTDENFILVSMAHSASMRYSERFAGILDQNWNREIKYVPSRGVKQAGFYVLVGASMPSVLVETGFLSNKKDEAYLNSKKGQREIAKTIYNSIVDYRKFYDEQMKDDN